MKIIFIRHGQAEHNRKLKFNEANNPPVQLTKLGIRQALKTAKKLKNQPFKLIYTSEIVRAHETAKMIQQKQMNKKCVLKTDRRINEFRSGYNNRYVLWWYVRISISKNRLGKRFNDGESLAESIKRVELFLDDIKKKHKNDTIAVVGHLHTYQVLRHLIEGRPFEANLHKNKLGTAQVYHFDL